MNSGSWAEALAARTRSAEDSMPRCIFLGSRAHLTGAGIPSDRLAPRAGSHGMKSELDGGIELRIPTGVGWKREEHRRDLKSIRPRSARVPRPTHLDHPVPGQRPPRFLAIPRQP